ncbi:hypothetical protein [Mucilaginibacter sp. AK015]|uniref:hypothetical protein n=1 Tax=Mucilaginibacter sp. AK015 TaxID=2723072 RepID=UPI001616877F|nr:hypothetical protein [Mucilaginibacter sp. AK015]MBB5396991.1 hypothetical protein [Mucilaginibacter sp. AK015]
MKKILIPLLLVFLMGCAAPKMVAVNMPEDQFKKEHASAKLIELSESRTVYRQLNYAPGEGLYKFYYFKNGKLTLMDEGFLPHGQTTPVPTPEF